MAIWLPRGVVDALSQVARDRLREIQRAERHRGVHRPIRTTPKAGRNEPCPCGSGIKFKRCCGA